MSKITIQKDSTLLVPDVPTVPYITGDGEIGRASCRERV